MMNGKLKKYKRKVEMLFFNKKNEAEKIKKSEDKGAIRRNVKDLKDLIAPGRNRCIIYEPFRDSIKHN